LHCSVPRSVTGERQGNVLGTHTLHKTGYLFATWGVLKYTSLYNNTYIMNDDQNDAPTSKVAQLPRLLLANILESARHKSVQNSMTYEVR
jgi:hypothetical protein